MRLEVGAFVAFEDLATGAQRMARRPSASAARLHGMGRHDRTPTREARKCHSMGGSFLRRRPAKSGDCGGRGNDGLLLLLKAYLLAGQPGSSD